MVTGVSWDVVVPTIGRASLALLLDALARSAAAMPRRIILVDDRRQADGPLLARMSPVLAPRVSVLRGRARGPAAARNVGWRASSADWVVFLDDDVVPEPAWSTRLLADLASLDDDVAGSQGRIRVPLPADRRPTDWERTVAGLERAQWATADMAYRRAALARAGGFDERFPRAYREDADLGLRMIAAGYRIVRGERAVLHPARPAGFWTSVAMQAGNTDDVLMRAVHGRDWTHRAGVAPGRRPRHLAITIAATTAVVAAIARRPRLAALAAGAWLAGTAEFTWARIGPGPRTPAEVARMALTSAVLPAAATVHWLRGWARLPFVLGRGPHAPNGSPRRREYVIHRRSSDAVSGPGRRRPDRTGGDAAVGRGTGAHNRFAPNAVLLDRDGTLVIDVPYNGDPERVMPVPGARAALDRLRAAGIALAVVSNQSGVARGLLGSDQVDAVNRRVETLLGPLGPWLVCPHGPADGCGCRKPAPGLILRAAAALGVPPDTCAVIGDTGADVQAACAAGARGILVPNDVTRRDEIDAAPEVAPDLGAAVDLLLGAGRPGR